ncbi:YkvA family protein [Roseibium aestuarii]|uniref:YkvA family protein n=1 Tax=Roseibium aestuarii TaxID=2600299 RepID=A0ABW4JXJ7_9HYPH|nr:YkvA family protein [Roseibium aestuarii]
MTRQSQTTPEDLFDDVDFDPARLGSQESQLRRIRDGVFRTARKASRQIPFLDEVLAAYYCLRDPATPARVRWTVTAALAYFVLPLDAVPDFILGLGFGDDATVLLAALSAIRGHIKPEHRDKARDALAREEIDVSRAAEVPTR